MDRPRGRRVLKFDGAFGPEGCGGGFAADFEAKERGSAMEHACGVRVDGPPARGLWPPDGGRLCSLRSGGNGPLGRGLWIALTGNEFYNAAFGGHVSIEYHNHSYPRTSLRHFVALFP